MFNAWCKLTDGKELRHFCNGYVEYFPLAKTNLLSKKRDDNCRAGIARRTERQSEKAR